MCPQELISCSSTLCDFVCEREKMDEHVVVCTIVEMEKLPSLEEKVKFLAVEMNSVKKQLSRFNELLPLLYLKTLRMMI
jgi:hypothetical protein